MTCSYNTISGTNNTIICSNNQTIGADISHQLRIGGSGNINDYGEIVDVRSLLLIMKTLLKTNGYNEELIYMKYDDLEKILNRESNINTILNESLNDE